MWEHHSGRAHGARRTGQLHCHGPEESSHHGGGVERNWPGRQPFGHSDGRNETALAILLEELLAAEIEEVCVVVTPGDQAAYTAAAGSHASLDLVC